MYVCMYMQMYANGNSGNFMMYYFNFTLVQFIITNHIFILSLSLSLSICTFDRRPLSNHIFKRLRKLSIIVSFSRMRRSRMRFRENAGKTDFYLPQRERFPSSVK